MRLRVPEHGGPGRWLVCALALACVAAAPPPPLLFKPGVVVDPGQDVVYLMAPGSGVDAVELSSGRLLWSTSEAAKPLLATDGLLIAQGETRRQGVLPIVVLDRRSGARQLEVEVPVPTALAATIDRVPGGFFEASARLEHDRLVVSWRHRRTPLSGVAPERNEGAGESVEEGAAEIDLGNGRVRSLGSGELPHPEARPLPAALAELAAKGLLLWPRPQEGGVLASVGYDGEGDAQRVRVRRWDRETGGALPDLLLEGSGIAVKFASADGRHLLASSRIEGASWSNYRLFVYSLSTGDLVATFPHYSAAAWFLVAERVVMLEAEPYGRREGEQWIEAPLRLAAFDIGSGELIWERPSRDTSYRGPLPPAG